MSWNEVVVALSFVKESRARRHRTENAESAGFESENLVESGGGKKNRDFGSRRFSVRCGESPRGRRWGMRRVSRNPSEPARMMGTKARKDQDRLFCRGIGQPRRKGGFGCGRSGAAQFEMPHRRLQKNCERAKKLLPFSVRVPYKESHRRGGDASLGQKSEAERVVCRECGTREALSLAL